MVDVPAMPLPASELPSRLYREMLRIRVIEETIAERYAEQEMRCPVHLSVGQEGTAVGVSAALTTEDQVLSTHRCHAHYLAKGGSLNAMMAEIYGRETGCCGGRGGSMHLFDDEAGMLLSLPIVGSPIGITVGVGLAFRQRGSRAVAVTFLGDGASEEGIFHESLNLAAVHRLPVLFVLENNLYSVYTNLPDRQPARPLTDLALAHGIPAVHGDGNDVLAVEALTRPAVERARAGEGPTLLVFDTYRWREHCGPNYDNDIGYRTEAEFLEWRERCPLTRLRRRLVAEGRLDDAADAALTAGFKAEMEAAIAFAKASPFPAPETVRDLIYV